jgi:hypothetical protein
MVIFKITKRGILVNVINNEYTRGDICSDLLRNGYDRPTGGKDVGDHPPMYVAFFDFS